MISDLDLVQLCAATYDDAPTLPVPSTGTDARVTLCDGITVVAFRGSTTAEDWARDFICAPIVDTGHPQLGECHAGFLDGAESIVSEVKAAIGTEPFIVTGHSLGGALALGVAALLLLAGRAAAAVVTFGSPRFGMNKFVTLMNSLPVRQYRNGNDPVPLIPFDVPPILEFLNAHGPLIQVGAALKDPFSCHHIGCYVQNVGDYLKGQSPK